MRLLLLLPSSLLVLGAACGAPEGSVAPPAAPVAAPEIPDPGPGPLGSPRTVAATVFEAEEACPHLGHAEGLGRGARPGRDAAGLFCRASESLGTGRYQVNVRLRSLGPSSIADELVRVRLLGDEGVLAQTSLWGDRLGSAPGYVTVSALTFERAGYAEVTVEVDWPGTTPVRIEALEIARAEPALIVGPASGPIAEGDVVRIETDSTDPKRMLELRCNDLDLTTRIADLVERGEAVYEPIGERTQLRALADSLLAGCDDRAQVAATLRDGLSNMPIGTSRVTYRRTPPACTFEPGTMRVLLSGFEPFPAGDPLGVNTSELAVRGFHSPPAGVSTMTVVLPVEWDSAAAELLRVVDACRPDVVLAFGQGPADPVEVEMSAFNRNDWPDLADNRGLRLVGERVVDVGPELLGTRLPADRIVAALHRAGVAARTVNEPRPYVCNDVFYRLLHHLHDRPVAAGFVHLPSAGTAGELSERNRERVVRLVVEETLRSAPAAVAL